MQRSGSLASGPHMQPLYKGPSIIASDENSSGTSTPDSEGSDGEKPNGGNSPPLPKWLIQKQTGWRRAVQHFTPSWFAITMGTGIIPQILHKFALIYPRYYTELNILSIIFFVLNVCLFTAISLTTILRYALYPGTWTLMIQHPVQSLFLGCVPMGFSTIITMFVAVCVPSWGLWSVYFAWAMWWIDAAISLACCVWLPFQMITTHLNHDETMTAAWLLPIISTIVAASCGGVVASVLPNPNHALWTVLTSYVLWGAGIPLALGIIVLYFHRLAVYRLPPQEVIVSVFLPVGPLGQGSFSIMNIGKVALTCFPETGTLHPMAGEILYVLGFGVSIVLWGFGLVWLFFAVASISRSKFPFNLGWWGFLFPLGVYSLATLCLGEELPSLFFRILGTIFGVSVILLWLLVAYKTIDAIICGTLFVAPCLKEIEKAAMEAMEKERQAA